jgi:hypothetical protein
MHLKKARVMGNIEVDGHHQRLQGKRPNGGREDLVSLLSCPCLGLQL